MAWSKYRCPNQFRSMWSTICEVSRRERLMRKKKIRSDVPSKKWFLLDRSPTGEQLSLKPVWRPICTRGGCGLWSPLEKKYFSRNTGYNFFGQHFFSFLQAFLTWIMRKIRDPGEWVRSYGSKFFLNGFLTKLVNELIGYIQVQQKLKFRESFSNIFVPEF